MITPIFNNLFSRNLNFGNSKMNVVYMNDMHGSLSFVDSFITARDEFYRENTEGTNWTLSGGDMFMKGSDNNPVIAKFIEKYVDIVGIGNHDIANAKDLCHLMEKVNIAHKFISANVDIDPQFKNSYASKIAKSTIIEDGDERVGFIGVSPFDFKKSVARGAENNFVSIKGLKDTVKSIRQEVEKLEDAGVDKIVLLAHTGEYSNDDSGINYYKIFAKIGGIDLIVGGHDHLMVDKWENSSRRRADNPSEFEPVRIVSTGSSKKHYFAENLNMFGTMNLTFDDDGVLIPEECTNDIHYTHDYPKTNFVAQFIDDDAKEVLKVINMPIVPVKNPLRNENKVANFVADADFWYVTKHSAEDEKPDFAFVNPGTIRDSFSNVEITRNQIKQVLPFKETIVKAELTKKQIYDALSISAESATYKKATPGLMQVSHMTYTVNPDFSVSDVKILDDEGNVRFNLDDMDDEDTFTCVYDSFLASGPNLLGCLKVDDYEDFNITRAKAMEEYLTSGAKIPDFMSDRINILKG